MEQGLSGYAGCRLLAFSKDSRRPDATKLADSLATCRARFEAAMYKAPARFGTLGCSETSVEQFRVYVETFADTASAAAGGAELPNLEPCVAAPTPTPGPTGTPEPTATPACTPAVVFNGKGGFYTDNCNGTVTDSTTGLVWEKKTDDGYGVHDVSRTYEATGQPSWSYQTQFLDQLNCQGFYTTDCTPWLGHTDWRLPTILELSGRDQTPGYATGGIVDLTAPGCGSGYPCINAIFGPTRSSYYWSSSTYQSVPGYAWGVYFSNGYVYNYSKPSTLVVRAVRSGS